MATTRLSFLSLVLLLAGLAGLAWAVYYMVKRRRCEADPTLDPPLYPSQLWMNALTHYPRWFLAVSLFIPLLLTMLGLAHSGGTVRINLDFDTYLQIDSELDSIAQNYHLAQIYQEESATDPYDEWGLMDSKICTIQGVPKQRRRRTTLRQEEEEEEDTNRTLQQQNSLYKENFFMGQGDTITLIYQNRNGGNVFEPEVLRDIYDLEQRILQFEGYDRNCFKLMSNDCFPMDSLVQRFFVDGQLVANRDDVLRSFLKSPQDIYKVDQFFSPTHLASNITKTRILLKNVWGKKNRYKLHPFLESLHHDLFWKLDQQGVYANMIFTWENQHLLQVEKNDATLHDTLWSLGSLLFIALMIFLKVQDAFVVCFALVGLLLAFSASYYWCLAHFDIAEITLLHVSGLFVMLGIGADDIFLMIDSFDHSKLVLKKNADDDDEQEDEPAADITTDSDSLPTQDNEEAIVTTTTEQEAAAHLDHIRKRMVWAYHTAGSMMLVSSTTTAVCFFSNAFGVIKVVSELGIFMGMVILCNYLHVMTILPSAILVNEIHFKPWRTAVMAQWRNRREGDATSVNSAQQDGASIDVDTSVPTAVVPHAADGAGEDQVPEETPMANDARDEMGKMDRWLMGRYAPFVTRRRYPIIVLSILFAIIMAIVGMTSFKTFNGSIVLFSEKYNFGRQTLINDKYFSHHLDQDVLAGPTPPPTTFSPTTSPVTLAPDETYAPTNPWIIASIGGAISPPGPAPVTLPPGETNAPSRPLAAAPGPAPSEQVQQGDLQVSVSTSGGSGGSVGSGSGGSVESGSGGSGSGSGWTGGAGGGGSGIGSSGGGGIGGTGSGGSSSASSTSSGTDKTGATDDDSVVLWVSDSETLSPWEIGKIYQENDLVRKESIVVDLIWGIDSTRYSSLWLVQGNKDYDEDQDKDEPVKFSELQGINRDFDLYDPVTQQWLYDVVQMARQDPNLNVQSEFPTWIEQLRDLAVREGAGFPLPREDFQRYTKRIVCSNRRSDSAEFLGTADDGLDGDILYASITIRADVVRRTGEDLSLSSFKKWQRFAEQVNQDAPPGVVPVTIQSDLFWNGYRAEETVNSTITTWLIANGVCFVIILLFTKNLLLCLMVLGTLFLIFLCITGWLFAVFGLVFGPVQALGVSIFIGLSANYSLHAAHSYHRARGTTRHDKVREAIFITGSPICASALSTLGGTAFLFACRTSALVELGILIFCVTVMALVYSMGFLLATLLLVGPLPYETEQGNRLHQCDIYALCLSRGAPKDMEDYGDANEEKFVPDKEGPETEVGSNSFRTSPDSEEEKEEEAEVFEDALSENFNPGSSSAPGVVTVAKIGGGSFDDAESDRGLLYSLSSRLLGMIAANDDSVEVNLERSQSLKQMDVEANNSLKQMLDELNFETK